MSVPTDSIIEKDPSAIMFYEFNWTDWLGTALISTSTFTVSNAPDAALTKDNPAIVSGSLRTRVRLLGGTVGKKYRLTNQIVTNENPAQTEEASVFIRIVDK